MKSLISYQRNIIIRFKVPLRNLDRSYLLLLPSSTQGRYKDSNLPDISTKYPVAFQIAKEAFEIYRQS